MKPNKRTEGFICGLLIGLILLNLPAYFFLVRPEIMADAGENERIEQARLELQKKISTIDSFKEIERKLAKSQQDYDQFVEDYLLPGDTVSSELIGELDQVCAQAGLLRNRVAYNTGGEAQYGIHRIAFTLPIEGAYSNIRKFLNILETRSRFVIVDSMVLESEREGTGAIRMDMNLSSYYVTQP